VLGNDDGDVGWGASKVAVVGVCWLRLLVTCLGRYRFFVDGVWSLWTGFERELRSGCRRGGLGMIGQRGLCSWWVRRNGGIKLD
jgi:hypothetical protein